MTILGRTSLEVPPVMFGTSALGNLYGDPGAATKLGIVRAIRATLGSHMVLDSAGKYGAGLSLEWIGRALRELAIPPEEVVISNKLGWYRVPLTGPEPTFERGVWHGLEHDAVQRISGEGILACYEQGNQLLGAPYRPALVSVHDHDDYLAGATSTADRERRWAEVLDAYRALLDLRQRGLVKGVGVGSKDWKVIRDLAAVVDLDWVMLACSLTVFTHPPELLAFIADLHRRGVGIINSAVFNGGFLTGQSEYFDYRQVDPSHENDRALIAWRTRFLARCQEFAVSPTVACVAFGLSAPGTASIAMNSSKPSRVAENLALATTPVPAPFWAALKQDRLIDPAYPHLAP